MPLRLSPITALLLTSRPSDIPGLIIAVVIDPIKREFWAWLSADMRQKCVEIVQPFRAHRDPASPVVLVTRSLRVSAAPPSFQPCLIFRRLASAMRQVRSSGLRPFVVQASTRQIVASTKVSTTRHYFIAAPAMANPTPFRSAAFVRESDNMKSAKAMAL